MSEIEELSAQLLHDEAESNKLDYADGFKSPSNDEFFDAVDGSK